MLNVFLFICNNVDMLINLIFLAHDIDMYKYVSFLGRIYYMYLNIQCDISLSCSYFLLLSLYKSLSENSSCS